MSRVYEALKKAESQRAVAEAQGAVLVTFPEPDRQPGPLEESPSGVEPVLAALAQAAARPEPERRKRRAAALVAGHVPRIVVGDPNHRQASEEFHILSLHLRNWSAEHGKSVFLVASALSGDGKSFVSLNLGVSLARLGNKVLVLDADLRAPTLHRVFDLVPMCGLTDYLQGAADFRACLQPSPIPGLLLVPAGGQNLAPSEMLAGLRMREFINEARAIVPQHYVIIDSPAASVAELPILGALADALLMVVSANRTPRELVKQTIEKVGCSTVFGVAFNRFEPPHSARSYYPVKYSRPGAGSA